jgi:hypothetical protein
LHAGANDFGSIMLEENVVSAAVPHIALLIKAFKKPFVKQVLNHSSATSSMSGENCHRQ